MLGGNREVRNRGQCLRTEGLTGWHGGQACRQPALRLGRFRPKAVLQVRRPVNPKRPRTNHLDRTWIQDTGLNSVCDRNGDFTPAVGPRPAGTRLPSPGP